MNVRMTRLKKFYCSISTANVEHEFTYTLSNNKATTEFYYGTNSNVIVPATLDGYTVEGVGNTTFSLGALKLENLDKPDNRNTITDIVFSNGIEKI